MKLTAHINLHAASHLAAFFGGLPSMRQEIDDKLPYNLVRSMRVLMALLVLGCIAGIVSAITGIQAFDANSRTGTVVYYWQGPWRWLALVYAAMFAVAFYAVYRRFPLAWKLGWVFLIGGALDFILQAWLGLIRQPYGWVGAIAATLGGIAVAVYWGFWWRKQKRYFIPDTTDQT